MPWLKEDPVVLKTTFVHAFNAPGANRSAVCKKYGVSRDTGYAISRRFHQHGEAGLIPASSAPLSPGNALSSEAIELVLAIRHSSPNESWAADMIRDFWNENITDERCPSRASIARILKQYTNIQAYRPVKVVRSTAKPAPAVCPNDVWAIDAKGLWRDVSPLTILDVFSRFLFCAETVRVETSNVQRITTRLFDEHGLPRRIRCDGGSPFGGHGFAQLCKLALWWIDLGIVVEHVGKPQHNGHLERLHRTLEQEGARDLPVQQALNRFRETYNEVRPHSGIGRRTPAEVYKPEPVAPQAHVVARYDDERVVRTNGYFRWHGELVFISEALVSRTITFRVLEENLWLVRYKHMPVAIFDEEKMKLRRCPQDVFEAFT